MKTIKQVGQFVRSNAREIILLSAAVFAFVLLVVAEWRPSVWQFIPEAMTNFLQMDALKNVVSSVSASVFAAYVFYVFVELLPAKIKREKIRSHLDSLLFVVLHSFYDESKGGPLLSLYASVGIANHFNNKLNDEFLHDLEKKLLSYDPDVESPNGINPLEQAAISANDKLPMLRFSTQMASELSLELGLLWSDIVACLHQISLKSPPTLVPMTEDQRRLSQMIYATSLLRQWLKLR